MATTLNFTFCPFKSCPPPHVLTHLFKFIKQPLFFRDISSFKNLLPDLKEVSALGGCE